MRGRRVAISDFVSLAASPDPQLDELALALAAEFGPVTEAEAMARLDELGDELAAQASGHTPEEEVAACREVLGVRHGFEGDHEQYDRPENSMLDSVLVRRRGLPILLSVIYVEAARRAGMELAGVGLPGHFVAGHFGVEPPLLVDPFSGGTALTVEAPAPLVRPWGPHETALRMLNNLAAAYERRGDLGRTITAARLRLALPLGPDARGELASELLSLEARLN